MNKCAFCGVEKLGNQQCARCKEVYYCDKKCQKEHWKEHKKGCLRFETCRVTTIADISPREHMPSDPGGVLLSMGNRATAMQMRANTLQGSARANEYNNIIAIRKEERDAWVERKDWLGAARAEQHITCCLMQTKSFVRAREHSTKAISFMQRFEAARVGQPIDKQMDRALSVDECRASVIYNDRVVGRMVMKAENERALKQAGDLPCGDARIEAFRGCIVSLQKERAGWLQDRNFRTTVIVDYQICSAALQLGDGADVIELLKCHVASASSLVLKHNISGFEEKLSKIREYLGLIDT